MKKPALGFFALFVCALYGVRVRVLTLLRCLGKGHRVSSRLPAADIRVFLTSCGYVDSPHGGAWLWFVGS